MQALDLSECLVPILLSLASLNNPEVNRILRGSRLEIIDEHGKRAWPGDS